MQINAKNVAYVDKYGLLGEFSVTMVFAHTESISRTSSALRCPSREMWQTCLFLHNSLLLRLFSGSLVNSRLRTKPRSCNKTENGVINYTAYGTTLRCSPRTPAALTQYIVFHTVCSICWKFKAAVPVRIRGCRMNRRSSICTRLFFIGTACAVYIATSFFW